MTPSSQDWLVTKRSGERERVDVGKIVKAVERCTNGLKEVDAMRVAQKTISGLFDGATTRELDQLSIQTAASLIAEEPQYSKLASRLLSTYVEKEVHLQEIYSFSQSINEGYKLGLIGDRLKSFVSKHARKLNDKVRQERDEEFEYFGLRTLYTRYLLQHPTTRFVIETPQFFFMRVACALAETVNDAIDLYNLISALEYMPSSPTLFNSGGKREQLSSCFLLDSPLDDLSSIYDRYKDIALLSQLSGGIGLSYSRVRSRGSLIAGTNGQSNGVVPWLKTLDSSVAAVDQGGNKRPGACCVYIEPWHADIGEFLELKDNTGDTSKRTYNLNLALWVPDLFMKRVEADAEWSLFDPKVMNKLPDLYGAAFEAEYLRGEREGLAAGKMKARDLYGRMMRTLAQTGNGWICFKDKCNAASNQTLLSSNVVHSSNLCTEITEVSSEKETGTCNLGSINLARHVQITDTGPVFDFVKLGRTVKLAVRALDNVIDLNYYCIPSSRASNMKWRPVGLGIMGLQDLFYQMKLPFDSEEARELSKTIQELIYYHALDTSADLAKEKGPCPGFLETRATEGFLQFHAWGVKPFALTDWDALQEKIKGGLRNSLLIAIAPTATIASICGSSECIEPLVSNLFKRETLSGDFIQINKYLVQDLKDLSLWSEEMLSELKLSEGSVQKLPIPEYLKAVYRTAWEIPQRSLIDMAADRGAFIDQSQSLNLFIENPNIGQLSSMYFYAWQKGLKTTYYLRSRPATKIAKATVEVTKAYTDQEAIACSLENPEICEACQ